MEAFAAEGRGMPQLNPEFWISQIFWLTLTFGVLYVLLSKLILQKISANLEVRKSQILENIEAAEKQREESEEKINKIAIETTSELLVKLIGTEVNNSSISAIVDDLSKRNGNKYYGN